jgi:hypothetical protein
MEVLHIAAGCKESHRGIAGKVFPTSFRALDYGRNQKRDFAGAPVAYGFLDQGYVFEVGSVGLEVRMVAGKGFEGNNLEVFVFEKANPSRVCAGCSPNIHGEVERKVRKKIVDEVSPDIW